MEKIIEFAVDNIQQLDYEHYDEAEYAIAKLGFLSTRPNSHKLDISEEVLRNCASSVLGKWVVADINPLTGDATTHTNNQHIVGYIPETQDIEFVEDEDGYLRAYAQAIISKRYAKDYCAIFANDNNRAVSVEMTVTTLEDDENTVTSFDIKAVTTLGKYVNPSCPQSDIEFVRFSEVEGNQYFKDLQKDTLTSLKNFAKERKEQMAEKLTYKIDKSKDALSDTPWGEVDKTELRNKIMEATNKATLVKAVYLLVEDGWEEAPSEHLKYPVMELKDNTFVYNRDALASALGYAKKEEETSVINKVKKIYKSLGLEESDGKGEKQMSEIAFAAVNINNLWSGIYNGMREKHQWDYYIKDIYEEDGKKFAIVYDDNHKLYRLDFTCTAEEGIVLADEIVEVVEEFIETDNIQKFAEPENVTEYRMAEQVEEKEPKNPAQEPKEEKMSEEDMMARISQLEADVASRDNIIMEKEAELSELREFKANFDAAQKAIKVEEVMEAYGKYMEKDVCASVKAEGMECQFSELDAWANKVKASVADKIIAKSTQNDDGFTRMSAPVDFNKKSGSVWSRL